LRRILTVRGKLFSTGPTGTPFDEKYILGHGLTAEGLEKAIRDTFAPGRPGIILKLQTPDKVNIVYSQLTNDSCTVREVDVVFVAPPIAEPRPRKSKSGAGGSLVGSGGVFASGDDDEEADEEEEEIEDSGEPLKQGAQKRKKKASVDNLAARIRGMMKEKALLPPAEALGAPLPHSLRAVLTAMCIGDRKMAGGKQKFVPLPWKDQPREMLISAAIDLFNNAADSDKLKKKWTNLLAGVSDKEKDASVRVLIRNNLMKKFGEAARRGGCGASAPAIAALRRTHAGKKSAFPELTSQIDMHY